MLLLLFLQFLFAYLQHTHGYKYICDNPILEDSINLYVLVELEYKHVSFYLCLLLTNTLFPQPKASPWIGNLNKLWFDKDLGS